MKSIRATSTRALPVGARVPTCDNSGAKMVKIFNVQGLKGRLGRKPSCGIGDLVMASVIRGRPDMRKQVTLAVVVRQRKPFRRPDGMRVMFEDNAVVIVKDDKGNPKGTIIKGPIPKEISERWPAIAKIATIVV